MKNRKQKGYVLAFVMIMSFILTVTVISTSTIIVRYLTHSKNNMADITGETNAIYYNIPREDYNGTCI